MKKVALVLLAAVMILSVFPVAGYAESKYDAKSVILMEAETGAVLYEKNIHEQLYPASITKILTALIVMEQCPLDEMVTYSNEAVNSINWQTDSNIGIKAGEQITVEQSLYGLLVGSANEVANALAEHVSGSVAEAIWAVESVFPAIR